jgi:hypothetical protein
MGTSTDLKGRVLTRIRTRRRGGVYISKDFLDLGTRAAVDQALSRLVKAGSIRRLGRGLFAYARATPGPGGETTPDPDRVAQALARKRGGHAQRSGGFAARELGLAREATEAPLPLYATDASPGTIKLGELTLTFKRVSPRSLSRRGRSTGNVIQALEFLGRDGVTEDVIARLRATLSEKDKAKLLRESRYAAGWIAEAAQKIFKV